VVSLVSGASSYTWSVPAGWSITGGQNTSTLSCTAGSFGQDGNIDVTAENACGTSLGYSIAVAVLASPVVSVSIAASPSTTVCDGSSVTFTATPANEGSAPVYQWFINGVPKE